MQDRPEFIRSVKNEMLDADYLETPFMNQLTCLSLRPESGYNVNRKHEASIFL